MKNDIKNMLAQSHDNQTKSDLVKVLSSFAALIGKEEFQSISGINLETDLDKMTKRNIVDVLGMFEEHYKPTWEDSLSSASSEIIKGMFGQIAEDEALFSTLVAGDSDFAAELGSIDFENLIGGPLNAAVAAQNNASLSTVNFIKTVGFDEDDKIRMTDFTYKKDVPKLIDDPSNPGTLIPDPSGATEEKTIDLKVPFISLLNVPSLRIETVEIDFNVKLNSVHTKNIGSKFKIKAELDSKIGGAMWGVKLKVTSSYKRTTSIGVKIEKEYSMNVKVKATNDEMPAGLEKVLGLLAG